MSKDKQWKRLQTCIKTVQLLFQQNIVIFFRGNGCSKTVIYLYPLSKYIGGILA